jgi:fibronectin-binding autotransporter adhesin
MLQLSRAFLGTLHERVGDQDGFVAPSTSSGADPLIWARVLGENGKQSGSGLGGSGPTLHYDLAAVQLGARLYGNAAFGAPHDDAGVYGSFGHVSSTVMHDGLVTGIVTAGTNHADAAAAAAYWSHYGNDGSYLDGVVQGVWFDSVRNRSSENVQSLSTGATGYGASLEGGWHRFALSPAVTLQPQAQVIYQHLRIDGASNDFEAVRFDDVGSLAARIGVQLANAPGGHGTLGGLNWWLAMSAWHEFHAAPRTTYPTDDGEVSFRSNLRGTWWQMKFGTQGQVTRHVDLYGSISYDIGGSAWRRQVGANLGVMVHW